MKIKKIISQLAVLALALAQLSITQAQTENTYYVPDAAGSPIAATDQAGNVKWRKHYRPFGEEIEQGESSKDNRIGYTGHVHDRDTGLTYMGVRYYDPVLGRFMGRDPVGFTVNNPLSMSRFAYAYNSPYKFVDPDGRASVLAEGVLLVGGAFLVSSALPGHEQRVDSLQQGWKAFTESFGNDDSSDGNSSDADDSDSEEAGKAREKGERLKDSDSASDQFEGIQKEQNRRRKQGDNTSIESIKKSKQRDQNALKPHNIDLDNLNDS